MKGEDKRLALEILYRINSQEWITDKEKEDFVQCMLKDENENIRGIAMIKWLEFMNILG